MRVDGFTSKKLDIVIQQNMKQYMLASICVHRFENDILYWCTSYIQEIQECIFSKFCGIGKQPITWLLFNFVIHIFMHKSNCIFGFEEWQNKIYYGQDIF